MNIFLYSYEKIVCYFKIMKKMAVLKEFYEFDIFLLFFMIQ